MWKNKKRLYRQIQFIIITSAMAITKSLLLLQLLRLSPGVFYWPNVQKLAKNKLKRKFFCYGYLSLVPLNA